MLFGHMLEAKTNPHSGILGKQQMNGISVETQIFASPFNPHSGFLGSKKC